MIKKIIYFCLVLASSRADADDFNIAVLDQHNSPVVDVVITLTPNDRTLNQAKTFSNDIAIVQQGAMFNPFVLAIHTGTKVQFPNKDNFRHHVYSFSKAKSFQLRLYGKDEEKFVTFDKPGIAALGCNIHDNMLAFVYITDAPLITKTNIKGEAILRNIIGGQYKMTVWHPDLKKDSWESNENIQINITTTPKLKHQVMLTTIRRKQEKPNLISGDYSR